MSVENCIVCKRKTYGALFCSLKHYSTYLGDKSRFKRKKPIKEILKERRDKAIENLTQANLARQLVRDSVARRLQELPVKRMSYWDHLGFKTSE